jgi:hypothetical protein
MDDAAFIKSSILRMIHPLEIIGRLGKENHELTCKIRSAIEIFRRAFDDQPTRRDGQDHADAYDGLYAETEVFLKALQMILDEEGEPLKFLEDELGFD